MKMCLTILSLSLFLASSAFASSGGATLKMPADKDGGLQNAEQGLSYQVSSIQIVAVESDGLRVESLNRNTIAASPISVAGYQLQIDAVPAAATTPYSFSMTTGPILSLSDAKTLRDEMLNKNREIYCSYNCGVIFKIQ